MAEHARTPTPHLMQRTGDKHSDNYEIEETPVPRRVVAVEEAGH